MVGPRLGVPGAGRVAGRAAARRVRDVPARDAAGDQLDPRARDALRVEAARERLRGRVGEVDHGRRDPVAAARGEQRLAAGELRLELLEQLGDGDRPEDDGRLAGRGGLRRALVEAVLGRRDERREVEPGGPGRDGLRAARAR